MGILTVERHTTVRRGGTNNPTESLRQRLANANDYFHRKASEVLNDEAALRLLAAMYKDVVMDISEFDPCENGIPLAKLTAANFCEIGKNVIYITEGGQRFIDSIEGDMSDLGDAFANLISDKARSVTEGGAISLSLSIAVLGPRAK